MVLVFFLILFYLTVQAQVRVVILFLVEFLGEKRKDVDIRSFLDLHNYVESSLGFISFQLDFNWFHWNQKLSDSVVDCSKRQFFSFECLNYEFKLRSW